MEQKAPESADTPSYGSGLLRLKGTEAGPLLRLLLLTLFLSVTAAVFSVYSRWETDFDAGRVQLAVGSFLFTVYFAACWYAWTRFRGSKELRWLMIYTAFLLLSCKELMEVADTLGLDIPLITRFQDSVVALTMAVAGVLLAWAGYTARLVRRPRIKFGLDHLIALACISGVAYFIWLHTNSGVRKLWWMAVQADAANEGVVSRSIYFILLIVLEAAFVLAAVSHIRLSSKTGDYNTGFLAYWCALAGLSFIYFSMSSGHFDRDWWISTVISAYGGIILIAGLNREHSKAYIGVQEKIGELEVLHALSWKLVGTGTLETLVEAFVWALTEHLRADIAAVFLKEQNDNSLRLASVAGLIHLPVSVNGVGKVYSLDGDGRPGFHSGHTAKAFKELKVVVVDDIYSDVEFLPWQVLAHQEGMVVSVPIINSGEVLGVYDLYLRSKDQIPPEKIRLFETVAAAAGAAIGHVQIREMAESMAQASEAA